MTQTTAVWERAYAAHPELAGTAAWPHVVEVLAEHPGDAVYEVGFGSGANLMWARQHGWSEIGGCEVARAPFDLARAALPGADLRLEDIIACSASDATYDVVLDRAAMSYLTPAELEPAVSHVHRILKPGGVFLLNPYGCNHTKPFPEQAPDPTYWDVADLRPYFPDDEWQLLYAREVVRTFESDAGSFDEHTLRILLRKVTST